MVGRVVVGGAVVGGVVVRRGLEVVTEWLEVVNIGGVVVIGVVVI